MDDDLELELQDVEEASYDSYSIKRRGKRNLRKEFLREGRGLPARRGGAQPKDMPEVAPERKGRVARKKKGRVSRVAGRKSARISRVSKQAPKSEPQEGQLSGIPMPGESAPVKTSTEPITGSTNSTQITSSPAEEMSVQEAQSNEQSQPKSEPQGPPVKIVELKYTSEGHKPSGKSALQVSTSMEEEVSPAAATENVIQPVKPTSKRVSRRSRNRGKDSAKESPSLRSRRSEGLPAKEDSNKNIIIMGVVGSVAVVILLLFVFSSGSGNQHEFAEKDDSKPKKKNNNASVNALAPTEDLSQKQSKTNKVSSEKSKQRMAKAKSTDAKSKAQTQEKDEVAQMLGLVNPNAKPVHVETSESNKQPEPGIKTQPIKRVSVPVGLDKPKVVQARTDAIPDFEMPTKKPEVKRNVPVPSAPRNRGTRNEGLDDLDAMDREVARKEAERKKELEAKKAEAEKKSDNKVPGNPFVSKKKEDDVDPDGEKKPKKTALGGLDSFLEKKKKDNPEENQEEETWQEKALKEPTKKKGPSITEAQGKEPAVLPLNMDDFSGEYKTYVSTLNGVAPGWRPNHCNMQASNFGNFTHCGRDGVIALNPTSPVLSAKLIGTVDVPRGFSNVRLCFEVSSPTKANDWRLKIKINQRDILPKGMVIAQPDKAPWKDIKIPISALSGKRFPVEIEVYSTSRNVKATAKKFGYIRNIHLDWVGKNK